MGDTKNSHRLTLITLSIASLLALGMFLSSRISSLPTQTYESKTLGLRFKIPKYVAFDPSNTYLVVERKDTAYIVDTFSSTTPEDSSFFVRVFMKDPRDTLEQALKHTILKSYPNCDLDVRQYDPSKQQIDLFGAVSTTIPEGVDELLARRERVCPPEYVKFFSQFHYDQKFPDRFIFIKNSNDTLYLDTARTLGWAETVELTR